MIMSRRTKEHLHVTIDKIILAKAKKTAKEKNIPLSRVIENFLSFFIDPKLYCFRCGETFSSSNVALCIKCGWMKCSECGACGCDLDENVSTAIFHMRRVYEDLLSGRVKSD